MFEFLTEFAKYMISSGVSLSEFQAAARLAFLQAAMGRARILVSTSLAAAITGLNRSQVRVVLQELEDGPIPQSSRLVEVLEAWQFDPQFASAAGAELRLPIRGDQRSFSALVQKYCGDISYKALLAELKKLNYVQIRGVDVPGIKRAGALRASRD
ncbi:MAG: hypothetical protein IPH71_14790 [Proteobacteria bacterium]|nr:hypothetical protein [Pseudomonadota bacterium]